MKISKPNIYFASNNSRRRRRRYFLILICKMEYRQIYDDYADGHTQNIQHVSFSLLVIRNNNDDENCFFKVSAHIANTHTQIENGGVKRQFLFFLQFSPNLPYYSFNCAQIITQKHTLIYPSENNEMKIHGCLLKETKQKRMQYTTD